MHSFGEVIMKKEEFKKIIKECVKSVMDEVESWEPYDAETDTMAPAPRDRTEPTGGDGLGIPEFPQAIIKKYYLDGQERWFVYSSPDPQALIIGWGKTYDNAIHNGKATAPYIKHGGVGHTGELKEGDWALPEPDPNVITLMWAKKRLKREGNRLNRDTLEKLIKMLEAELNQSGPTNTPLPLP